MEENRLRECTRSLPHFNDRAITRLVALVAFAILWPSTIGLAQDATSPDEQGGNSVLQGSSGGGDAFSSGSGNNPGDTNSGGGPDSYNRNGGGDNGSPDSYNSNGGGDGNPNDNTPTGYSTPPPRFPCGPNALENQ